MIASIFEDCKKITKENPLDLGFLLSAFFRVFGNPKNFNKTTVLNYGGLEVDFAGNFQAALCTMIFDHSYKTIVKGLEFTSECPNSVLSRIVDCKSLQRFRDKSLRLEDKEDCVVFSTSGLEQSWDQERGREWDEKLTNRN